MRRVGATGCRRLVFVGLRRRADPAPDRCDRLLPVPSGLDQCRDQARSGSRTADRARSCALDCARVRRPAAAACRSGRLTGRAASAAVFVFGPIAGRRAGRRAGLAARPAVRTDTGRLARAVAAPAVRGIALRSPLPGRPGDPRDSRCGILALRLYGQCAPTRNPIGAVGTRCAVHRPAGPDRTRITGLVDSFVTPRDPFDLASLPQYHYVPAGRFGAALDRYQVAHAGAAYAWLMTTARVSGQLRAGREDDNERAALCAHCAEPLAGLRIVPREIDGERKS